MGKMDVSDVVRYGLHSNWWVPGLCIGPSCLGYSHKVFESRLEVFVEISVVLHCLGDGKGSKDVINAKLLQYVIYKLVLEFHSIVRQYEPGSHVDGDIIVDKDTATVSTFLVRNWKASGHAIKWPVTECVGLLMWRHWGLWWDLCLFC